ncbi:MAG TPA: right-handed parallel beta-helix repeat-containing protein [Candidatus Norongarragalinales archaeon]|nr:right-handed parallel beta-helix repeat-containing protein [Candidatus Norongarragalinales archaeon]
MTISFSQAASALTFISSCQTLSTPGETYQLTTSVTSTGTCMNIAATGITLDCVGFTMTGNQAFGGVGANINAPNGIVQNCNIANFREGVNVNNAANSLVTSNTITTGSVGVRLVNSPSTTVSGNAITNFALNSLLGAGVFIPLPFSTASHNSIITGNTLTTTNQFGVGIRVDTANGIVAANNAIHMPVTTGAGIVIVGNNSNVTSNTVEGALGIAAGGGFIFQTPFTGYGILVANNTVSNGTASNSVGILVGAANGAVIEWNNITNFTSVNFTNTTGIILGSTNNSNVTSNRLSQVVSGIIVTNPAGGRSFGNRMENNHVSQFYRDSFLLNLADSNTLLTNTAKGFGFQTEAGFHLVNSNFNLIRYNLGYMNPSSSGIIGISFGNSTNNTMYNNTMSFSSFVGLRTDATPGTVLLSWDIICPNIIADAFCLAGGTTSGTFFTSVGTACTGTVIACASPASLFYTAQTINITNVTGPYGTAFAGITIDSLVASTGGTTMTVQPVGDNIFVTNNGPGTISMIVYKSGVPTTVSINPASTVNLVGPGGLVGDLVIRPTVGAPSLTANSGSPDKGFPVLIRKTFISGNGSNTSNAPANIQLAEQKYGNIVLSATGSSSADTRFNSLIVDGFDYSSSGPNLFLLAPQGRLMIARDEAEGKSCAPFPLVLLPQPLNLITVTYTKNLVSGAWSCTITRGPS